MSDGPRCLYCNVPVGNVHAPTCPQHPDNADNEDAVFLHEIAALRKRVMVLEGEIRQWEEDSACLPEDYSITGWVSILNGDKKALNDELTTLHEQVEELDRENTDLATALNQSQDHEASMFDTLKEQAVAYETLRQRVEELEAALRWFSVNPHLTKRPSHVTQALVSVREAAEPAGGD